MTFEEIKVEATRQQMTLLSSGTYPEHVLLALLRLGPMFLGSIENIQSAGLAEFITYTQRYCREHYDFFKGVSGFRGLPGVYLTEDTNRLFEYAEMLQKAYGLQENCEFVLFKALYNIPHIAKAAYEYMNVGTLAMLDAAIAISTPKQLSDEGVSAHQYQFDEAGNVIVSGNQSWVVEFENPQDGWNIRTFTVPNFESSEETISDSDFELSRDQRMLESYRDGIDQILYELGFEGKQLALTEIMYRLNILRNEEV